MHRRLRFVLRLFFIAVGVLAGLLGVSVLVLFLVFSPPTLDVSGAMRGAAVYLSIALVSLFAAWRLKLPADQPRGFEVIPRRKSNAE
jgi:H+/Cl- antiporter ClcA